MPPTHSQRPQRTPSRSPLHKPRFSSRPQRSNAPRPPFAGRPRPHHVPRTERPELAIQKMQPNKKGVLKFLPLGGCGEVTRSCYVYEYEDDIVIVDMGFQFPEDDMPGIDFIIPNISYLRPKRRNIRGIIITHGH